jgi:hypothetical protein
VTEGPKRSYLKWAEHWSYDHYNPSGVPHKSVELVVVTHFSIYFLHEPLDFVFTLARNLAKMEIFLIFLRSRRKYNFVFFFTFIYFLFLFLFLRDLRKIRKFSIFAKFPASVDTKSSGSCRIKWKVSYIYHFHRVTWVLRLNVILNSF